MSENDQEHTASPFATPDSASADPSTDAPEPATGGAPTAAATKASSTPAGERVRVHALAKELGTTSKVVLAELEALGDPRRSASAVLTAQLAEQVRARFASAGEDPAAPGTSNEPAAGLVPQLSDAGDEAPSAAAEPEESAQSPALALFVAPEAVPVQPRRATTEPAASDSSDDTPEAEDSDDDGDPNSRRRRRGRRGRGKKPEDASDAEQADDASDDEASKTDKTDKAGKGQRSEKTNKKSDKADKPERADKGPKSDTQEDDDSADSGGSSRRRRRRRRRGDGAEGEQEATDEVRGVSGSVRLEAKRQRRKEGRDAGRRRAPILTEAQFLARREAVTRKMIVRQRGERTQIAVLEDDVLVEHYVTLASEQSFAGSVYYGRVQNVLPSMEAAFVDIGKKRNAVLYAGEVNWDAAGLEGKQRSIEQAMKSGDKVLVQVTKDPIGHKGARLTSQISLPGRYLVYVPGGSMTGISRKLPDAERQRLKEILRRIVPDDAGVIIRTAAEGATEEELTRDVNRLKAQWEVIEQKVADSKTQAPSMLYEEPDLAIRVVRDLFNEDFSSMEISGDEAWETISSYISHVAPDLSERVTKYDGDDIFEANRVDEQLDKALERKVWLPSGGSLVIDHTEAMTVIDVNTGKFTGSGGNLEQTVTRNNLEAAEEIVRQLRLRDVGGIVVIDFIDMLLESNRDLVLRRLTECLGRDRTKHQVAEVTSLGLVQMTRKRVGQGLLDAFSEPCPHCDGRGLIVHHEPVEKKTASPSSKDSGSGSGSSSGRRRGRKGGNGNGTGNGNGNGDSGKDAVPVRDSSAQLSAIAAASAKRGEGGGPDEPEVEAAAGGDDHSGAETAPAAAAVVTADAPPKATSRRRRAARRPAGPPKNAD
ncbi:Rne/Rng family ribonuclease [Epidermidibacterium keratini]|uniref:Ribonuclease E n=1 Tax=Epidermidibacterium keratini TaxID=1891644 RepID=A0A7L4YJX9_9ACTN|nr:ribonuclease E/G [Epidermidibacterium keratini]QHB99357.1 Rne/Rng family ribonuclease [Epidermidibacterium keratini]